jgi:photosystem II stability/assembly factor-like uncharacterized protein
VDSLTGYCKTAHHIFKTTDGGDAWTVNEYVPWSGGKILFVTPTIGWATKSSTELIRTTDAGESWNLFYSGSTGIFSFHFVDTLHGWIVDGGYSGVVRRTTDGGVTWIPETTGATSYLRTIVALNSDTVFVAGNSGFLARSTDGGIIWALKNSGIESDLNSLAMVDSKTLFVGDFSGGIYRTTSGGLDWTKTHNLGGAINQIQFAAQYVGFAVMDGALLKTTTGGGLITSVDQGVKGEVILPAEVQLYQNYPNPFNPITKIKYEIPSNVKSEMSNVKLIVYDILGTEIATLVNEEKATGNYEVEFDATTSEGLSSGVYFYQLRTGSFIETKKMVLMR